MPTTVHELETARSDESVAIAVEDSSKVVLDADATDGTLELQTELDQETDIPSAQETEVDVVSSSKDAPTAHDVETEVEADTHGPDTGTISKNDLAVEELPEKTEQHVIPITKVFDL